MAEYSNPYKELVDAGCEIDHHESDLYVKYDAASLAIVKASGWTFTAFRSQIDGSLWLDVPFAYEPWWDAKSTGTA